MQAFSLSGMDFRHQGTGQFHQVKAQDYCWYFEAEQSDERSKSTYGGFNVSNCILNLHFKMNFGTLYISRREGEKNIWEKKTRLVSCPWFGHFILRQITQMGSCRWCWHFPAYILSNGSGLQTSHLPTLSLNCKHEKKLTFSKGGCSAVKHLGVSTLNRVNALFMILWLNKRFVVNFELSSNVATSCEC